MKFFIACLLLMLSLTLTLTSVSYAAPEVPETRISLPFSEAVVSGEFVIKGKTSDDTKAIRVTITDMFDRRQTPLKTYQATLDKTRDTWGTRVGEADLSEGYYVIQAKVTKYNGDSEYIYSTFITTQNLPTI